MRSGRHRRLSRRVQIFLESPEPLRLRDSGSGRAHSATVIVMAGQTDLHFTVDDMKSEHALIPNERFKVIPWLRGHMAGPAWTGRTRASSSARSRRFFRPDIITAPAAGRVCSGRTGPGYSGAGLVHRGLSIETQT